MRLFLYCVVVAWAHLALPGNYAIAAESAPRAVFINPGKQGETFWELTAETMRVAAKQLDVELEVLWAERNKLNLRKLGLDVTSRDRKPDYLILVNEEDAALPVLQAAEREGIRTLFVFNSISAADMSKLRSDNDGRLATLGSLEPDMFGAGRRMSERLVAAARQTKLHSPDGMLHMLALAGDEITPTSIARTEGALGVAQSQPDIVVDRVLFANWAAAEAERLTGRYLDLVGKRNLKPGIIWAANDSVAQGAIAALKAKGLRPGKDTVVAGLNWSPEGIELVERGELLLTDGGHFLGGGIAVALLRAHANGCGPLVDGTSRPIPLQLAAIDQATAPDVKEFLKKRRFDRIDFRSLSSKRGACAETDSFSVDALLRKVAGGS